MTKRLAIVGFCKDSRDWAPYEDENIDIWGLNRGYIFMHRANRWFDMHGHHILTNDMRRPSGHIEWLKKFPGSVYMHEANPDIPNTIDYPLEAVASQIAGNVYRVDKAGVIKSAADEPYLSSSIAQEIALAITEGYEEIALYGIDLNTDSEYAWQKPGVEYMLGVAAGRGIKIILPDNCPLLKGTIYGRGYLSPKGEQMSMEQLQTRMKSLEKQQHDLSRRLAELIGAKRELEFVQSQMVPGLDHEKLDERRQSMQQGISRLQQELLQVQGGIKEMAYWIHQTPSGQDPKEAIAQLRGSNNGHENGHSNIIDNVDGPITELEVLQYPEQADIPVLMPAGV